MRTSSSSLAARPSACSRTSSVVTGSSVSWPGGVKEPDRALDGGVDGLGGRAVAALDELAKLIDHRSVATRLEHVQERLRREDLPDRRRERRPTGLGADATDLLEHLQQPIRGGVRAKVHLERCDEPGREVVLCGANGDARSDGRDGLVADPLVDDVRRLPELVDVDARRVPEPLQRLRDRLTGDAMERERERVHRCRNQVCARVDGRERRREPDARGALHVEADREATRLPQPDDELLCSVRHERPRRIVHEDRVGALARAASGLARRARRSRSRPRPGL